MVKAVTDMKEVESDQEKYTDPFKNDLLFSIAHFLQKIATRQMAK
jgi:hypothetical protein